MDFASIPLTPHSAPIDEYIVLWTADKYKKLKKWHDGYLRYHTFNKRLLVYDHLMNKVCDKFLPEPEPIDVGDELVFDSHLITIEDVKGRQTQDLRPLFEKTVDRRRERGSTATPLRTVGTPSSTGQSPTPTLLRNIQSRPSTGNGHPVYPSPVPRPTLQESPGPNLVVPQKRTSQGAPIVQKINYKPFKVSRVKDSRTAPAAPTKDNRDNNTGNNYRKRRGEVGVSPDLGLATNVVDADNDAEMLELDLQGNDFAPRPKPLVRARPNAPPPFKPPRPHRNVQKDTEKESDRIEEALPSPHAPVAGAPMSQATNHPRSSPRIPPSTITNYSQDLCSSPSFGSRPKNPPLRVPVNPTEHVSSPTKSPSPIPSPDPLPEKVIKQPKRLALPSATSRNRRKLLCGPSGRQNGANRMISLARPVSTLSILDAFPKDDVLSEPVRPRKGGGKNIEKGSPGVLSSKTSTPNFSEERAPKQNNVIGQNALPQPQVIQSRNSSKQDTHWKPLWKSDDKSRDPVSPSNKPAWCLDTTDSEEIQLSDSSQNTKERMKNKTSEICIFSSDEEDLEVIITKPAPKRPKKSISLDSDLSSDEFEPLRSSAVPKHLVGQSRNAKLQSRQAVPEASRVWREDGSLE